MGARLFFNLHPWLSQGHGDCTTNVDYDPPYGYPFEGKRQEAIGWERDLARMLGKVTGPVTRTSYTGIGGVPELF